MAATSKIVLAVICTIITTSSTVIIADEYFGSLEIVSLSDRRSFAIHQDRSRVTCAKEGLFFIYYYHFFTFQVMMEIVQ